MYNATCFESSRELNQRQFVSVDNSIEMYLFPAIKDTMSPIALSKVEDNAVHQVFQVHIYRHRQISPVFQKWNLS